MDDDDDDVNIHKNTPVTININTVYHRYILSERYVCTDLTYFNPVAQIRGPIMRSLPFKTHNHYLYTISDLSPIVVIIEKKVVKNSFLKSTIKSSVTAGKRNHSKGTMLKKLY